jgi:hypothetical protein
VIQRIVLLATIIYWSKFGERRGGEVKTYPYTSAKQGRRLTDTPAW